MRERRTQKSQKEIYEELVRATYRESSGLVSEPIPESKRPGRELSQTQALRLQELKKQVEEAARLAEEKRQAEAEAQALATQATTKEATASKAKSRLVAGATGNFAVTRAATQSQAQRKSPWQPKEGEEIPDVDEDVQVHTRELLSASMYDDLINWDYRLTRETPLFDRAFSAVNAQSVCDVGSGTGRHSVMFAQWGMDVIGVDPTGKMIKRASNLANQKAGDIAAANGSIRFKRGDLGRIAHAIAPDKVDALVCVGDVLPQAGSLTALRAALDDFAEALVPSGMLVLEFANHTRYSQTRVRSTTPAVFDTTEGTKVFLSVMDYPAGSTIINADAMTLTRGKDGKWRVKNAKIQNLFISPEGIRRELVEAGFDVLEIAGDFTGRPLEPYEDESMIIVARRKRHRPIGR